MKTIPLRKSLEILSLLATLAAGCALAQAPLLIYSDQLVNGFQNWSWIPSDFSATYSGSNCISASANADWQALWLEHSSFNTTLYTDITFWINGGPAGGQVVEVVGLLDGNGQGSQQLPSLPANRWLSYTIPFSILRITGQTNCDGFLFDLTSFGATNTFYVAAVRLGAAATPALTHIALDAADLRGQITDYFGPAGTNIELLVTENNSNDGEQGKQSTSLVNGLYYAKSLCQLMKTEFNSFVWWDLRNGLDTNGSMDPSLYGWRLYGDLGLINGLGTALSNRYPTYFAAKLMQYFIRAGDTVLNATSDYSLLSAYAARRSDGSLRLLVVNQDSVSNLTAQIVLTNFAPGAVATLYSYGLPQDNAARTGPGSCDIAQTNFSAAGTNFSYTFAPYSLTLFVLAPAAPVLGASLGGGGQFVLQLKGQPNVPYVLQTSTNLVLWTPVSTNTPPAGTLNLTNSLTTGSPALYWRALWQP